MLRMIMYSYHITCSHHVKILFVLKLFFFCIYLQDVNFCSQLSIFKIQHNYRIQDVQIGQLCCRISDSTQTIAVGIVYRRFILHKDFSEIDAVKRFLIHSTMYKWWHSYSIKKNTAISLMGGWWSMSLVWKV